MKKIISTLMITLFTFLAATATKNSELEIIQSKTGIEKAKALIIYADQKIYEGSYVIAKNLYNESLEILKQEKHNNKIAKELMIDININLSNLNQNYYTDYYSSINQLFVALNISKEINNKYKIGITNYLIGVNYRLIEKYNNSIEFFDNAIVIFKEINDTNHLISTMNEKANVFYYLREYKKSESTREEAYNIALKTGNNNNIYYIKHDKAILLLMDRKYAEAISIFKEFFYHKAKTQIPRESAISASNIADTYSKSGLLDSAFHYAMIADSIATKYSLSNERIQSLSVISALYQARNDFFNAYVNLLKLMNLKDSTFNLESNRQIEELNTIYQNEKKQNIINYQKNKLNEKNLLTLVLVLGIFLLLSVASVLLYSYNQKKKSNVKLNESNKLIEEQMKLLNINNDELVALNKMKDKFFSIISHDLKGPISSQLAGLKEISDSLESLDGTNNLQDLTKETLSSTESTYQLLETLLTWSRSQSNKISFNPEPANVKMIVTQTLSVLSKNFKDKSIELKINIPEETEAKVDVSMFSTIIRNLVNNAIKFSNVNSKITVESKELSTEWQFSVEDEGVGMSKDTLDNLFNIGSVKTTLGTKNEQGTGLGLILVNEFVHKHNGKIWVESEEGKGTKISFTLPKQMQLS
jgi:signal transduction histidine kinase